MDGKIQKLVSAGARNGGNAASSIVTESLISVILSYTSCKAVYRFEMCRQDDVVKLNSQR